MKKGDFTETVIQTAQAFGWLVAHFRSVRIARADGTFYYATPVAGDAEGFPDTFMVQPVKGWRLVAELKGDTGTPKPNQRAWLEACERVGIPAYRWRPKDWDEIQKVLRDGPGSEGVSRLCR